MKFGHIDCPACAADRDSQFHGHNGTTSPCGLCGDSTYARTEPALEWVRLSGEMGALWAAKLLVEKAHDERLEAMGDLVRGEIKYRERTAKRREGAMAVAHG